MAPFGKFPVAAAKIVIDNRSVASLIEDFIGVRSDVPGPAGDEDHESSPIHKRHPAKVSVCEYSCMTNPTISVFCGECRDLDTT